MRDKLLIIGATSVLAQETAKIFAQDNASFVLVARNAEKLHMVAEDLRQKGAHKILEIVMNVNEFDRYASTLEQAVLTMGGLDIAFIAHGSASEQRSCEQNLDLLREDIQTNFVSTASLLMVIADFFERQQKGTIAVISSVAGDRGRRNQYIYASSKAALTVFLQGLRQRLYAAGVAVVTIKLGLVDTPMTSYLKNSKRRILFTKPANVARSIYKAIKNKKEEIYLPWFWKYIMAAIKMIPESVFKKVNF